MLDHEKLKQRRAEGSRGGALWKPKEGSTYKVRILPLHSRILGAWELMEDVALQYEIHFFNIEGKQPTERTRCLKDAGKKCPACDTYWTHYKSSDPGLAQITKRVKAGRQYLMNILDINNLAAGVQRWAANYSSWDKILEMAADSNFGNILDPANGVNLIVTVTPGKQTKNGFTAYDVAPERDGGKAGPVLRTSVMPVLDALPNWKADLDALADHVPAYKTEAEILGLLAEMRFPGIKAPGASTAPAVETPFSQAVPGMVAAEQPQPRLVVGAPAPVVVPGVTPIAAPIAAPSIVPIAAPAPTAAPTAVAQASAPHYDPGPQYTPKVADSLRPTATVGGLPIPRCFGDYDPARHRCQPCPALSECQIKVMGIS